MEAVSNLNLANKSLGELQPIFAETLNAGIHGLSFSPYVEGQDAGSILSSYQIQRRMEVICPYTQNIRSFSCTEGNELIPRIARERGLNTMVGAWISGDRERNEREIQALIRLAKEGVVDVATVGNEVLMRGELTPEEIIDYIERVRAQIPADVPVGYVDAYYQFLDHPALIDAVDVVLINCYPFWEGAENKYAVAYLDRMYELTQQVAGGKPIIITETGWPSSGQAVEAAEPSKENALRYFIDAQTWAASKGIDMFYFSSFDESWKVTQEGEVGGQWGIWDKNEHLKYGTLTRL
ncbi:MAG: glycosyl hydrolase family 17 protein [Bacteroidota bacterium]